MSAELVSSLETGVMVILTMTLAIGGAGLWIALHKHRLIQPAVTTKKP